MPPKRKCIVRQRPGAKGRTVGVYITVKYMSIDVGTSYVHGPLLSRQDIQRICVVTGSGRLCVALIV